jgi:hypothetical protein
MLKKNLISISFFLSLQAHGQWWQHVTSPDLGFFAIGAYTSFLAHAYSDDYVEPTAGSAVLAGGAYFGVRTMLEQEGVHFTSESDKIKSLALGVGVGSVAGKGFRYGSRSLHYLAGVLYGRLMSFSSSSSEIGEEL